MCYNVHWEFSNKSTHAKAACVLSKKAVIVLSPVPLSHEI